MTERVLRKRFKSTEKMTTEDFASAKGAVIITLSPPITDKELLEEPAKTDKNKIENIEDDEKLVCTEYKLVDMKKNLQQFWETFTYLVNNKLVTKITVNKIFSDK